MNSPAAWSNRRTPHSAGNASSARSTPDAADARRAPLASARHCPNRTVLGILGRDGAFAEYPHAPRRQPDSDSRFDPRRRRGVRRAARGGVRNFRADRISREIKRSWFSATAGLARSSRSRSRARSICRSWRDIIAEKLARLAELGLDDRRRICSARQIRRRDRLQRKRIRLSRAQSNWSRPRGTIILKSTAAAAAELNLAPIVVNEITVIGSRCGRFQPALDALAAGKIDPRPLIDRHLHARRRLWLAFEAAKNPLNFKILLSAS